MTWWRKKCVELAKHIRKILDNYTCQKCGKKVTWMSCHWSHVISEGRNKKLSCDIWNIKVLCAYCHRYFRHEQPLLAAERFKRKFPARSEYLIKKNQLGNGTVGKQYFIDKHKELSGILNRLQEVDDPETAKFIDDLIKQSDPKYLTKP